MHCECNNAYGLIISIAIAIILNLLTLLFAVNISSIAENSSKPRDHALAVITTIIMLLVNHTLRENRTTVTAVVVSMSVSSQPVSQQLV